MPTYVPLGPGAICETWVLTMSLETEQEPVFMVKTPPVLPKLLWTHSTAGAEQFLVYRAL